MGLLQEGRQVNNHDINDLLKAFDNPNHCYPQRLVDAIRLLIKERDESRREVCELKSYNFEDKITPKAYSELRKWDCFKEEK
jgi:hypothetical protein